MFASITVKLDVLLLSNLGMAVFRSAKLGRRFTIWIC